MLKGRKMKHILSPKILPELMGVFYETAFFKYLLFLSKLNKLKTYF